MTDIVRVRPSHEAGSVAQPVTREQAAAHLGLRQETYRRLVKCGLFPPHDPTTNTISKTELDQTYERVLSEGFHPKTLTRKSQFKKIPYATVVWKKVEGGCFRPHVIWRHCDDYKKIKHEWGLAPMTVAWFELERDHALRFPDHSEVKASSSPAKTQETSSPKRLEAVTLVPSTDPPVNVDRYPTKDAPCR
jgi:hypothetical protein